MEDKNQQKYLAEMESDPSSLDRIPEPPKPGAVYTTPSLFTKPPPPGITEGQQKKANLLVRLLRRVDLLLLGLIVLGLVALVIFIAVRGSKADQQSNISSKYETQQIPFDGLETETGVDFGPRKVIVNGALQLNGGIVIAPSLQPTSPTAGQLYFGQDNNQLAYYNGTEFVNLGGGVASFQGESGNITLIAGDGISITGTTISNTRTISAASVQGTTGQIAKFTDADSVGDSLLSESGTTVTVSGSLSITSSLSLGSALGVANGGTGATSLTANGLLLGQGTGAVSAVTASGSGQCLVSTSGAPAFTACPGSGGVTSVNSLSGALTVANATAAGSTITIDNATNGAKGIASFNATNFSVSSGAVNTIQDIGVTASPTFVGLTLSGAVSGVTTLSTSGIITQGTLGAADTTTTLCRNTLNQIATCSGGGGTSFIQGGNSFTATATLGTNDANQLELETSGTTRLTIGTAGGVTLAANNSLSMASGTGTFGQIYTGTTTDAHTITANSLTTASAFKLTSSNNSGANTAWSAAQLNITNAQAATAVSTGSIYGFDLQFTQNPSVVGNTESVANFALAQNNASATDNTVTSVINVANNDTAAGNQITATNGLLINGANITNGLNLSGTFGTNLITSTNFTVTQGAALTLGSTGATTFTTPGSSSSVPTKINIPAYDPGAFGQVLAFGVTSSAGYSSRALSVFDARAISHQPTIGVFSPDENTIIGFNWDGSNATGLVQTNHAVFGGDTDSITLQSGNVAGGSGTSGNVAVQSGTITGGTGLSTGTVTIKSGNAASTDGSSGALSIDTGSKNGAGTTGAITIGTTNASSITIGGAAAIQPVTMGSTNSTSVTTIQGGTGTAGGDINIGDQATASKILDIGSVTNAGTGTVNIATAAAVQTVNVGSTNGASALNLNAGSGNALINATSGTITLQTTTSGAINIRPAGSSNIVLGTSDTVGTLLVLDTKTDAGDPAGVVGGMYYNSNRGKMRCFEYDYGSTGAWRDCITAARTALFASSDFMASNSDTNFIVGGSNGGGNSSTAITSVAGHPGVIQHTTAASAAGRGSVVSEAQDGILLGNNDVWRFEADVRVTTLSTGSETYTYRAGFVDNNDGESTDGCFFRYTDGTNSGKWQGVCRNNGSESTCDTTITVATATWYRLNVLVNGAGTSVDFQTDGTSRCQVTTDIPTGAGRGTGYGSLIKKSAGTTARTIDLDYMEILGQLNTSR